MFTRTLDPPPARHSTTWSAMALLALAHASALGFIYPPLPGPPPAPRS